MASIPCSEVGDVAANVKVKIDGVAPAVDFEPGTPEEAAEFLSEAHEAGQVVAPVGGATALSLGNVPERIDVALSTRGLAGVLAYEPADMTLSVLAGTRFAEVQALLAKKGQTLPVDVACREQATIGGMIATGIFGPSRTGSPTFRDLLIGLSTAHPSGMVTKAGGMVVKNVSGFDLMRLNLGALGTLGLVVSANFKVLPLARSEMTVVARYPRISEALAAANRVRDSRVRPTSLEVFADDGTWCTAVRIEGRQSTVRLLATESAQTLYSETETIGETESAEWWQRYTDDQAIDSGPSRILIRASVRPKLAAEAAANLWDTVGGRGVAPHHFSVAPGVGQITFRVDISSAADGRTYFDDLLAAVRSSAEHFLVLAAPPHLKQQVDVWGESPTTIDVMRALKQEFDPGRVLNRGRFAGRI